MAKTLGFIGLGAMGFPMARSILKKGPEKLLVYDVMPGKADSLAAEGALAAPSDVAVMEAADLLFLCLPTNALVEQALDKAIQHMKSGGCVVDFSSTAPGIVQAASKAAKAKRFDGGGCPVSGGSWGRRRARWPSCAAAREAAFALAEPYLKRVVAHRQPPGP